MNTSFDFSLFELYWIFTLDFHRFRDHIRNKYLNLENGIINNIKENIKYSVLRYTRLPSLLQPDVR